MSKLTPTKAIVIGGSISGLLAARVLSDYFERVTIVDRDSFPDTPRFRMGVPQSHHPHVLLVRGQEILERFFPGLEAELDRRDASEVDWSADFRWHLQDHWTPRFPSGFTSRACTRALLESVIRQHLQTNPRIEIVEGQPVTGLLTDPGRSTVTGIQTRDRQFSADLVIDAGGRNSPAPKWLEAIGYDAPTESTVKSFLGYASRAYESLDGTDYKMLYIMPHAPHHSRGAVVQKAEGGQWLVNLIGIGKDIPPTDEAGFLEFARSLRSPEVYAAIAKARPVSPIHGYQRTENRWRHYEKLSRFPENFALLGDSVCAFNPVYGQGMTAAALGALTLDHCLDRYCQRGSLTGFSKDYLKSLARVNQVPWLMATGDDYRWPTTVGGRRNAITRLSQTYLDRVMAIAPENTEVYLALIEVMHFLKSPLHLCHPSILRQVLWPANPIAEPGGGSSEEVGIGVF